MVMEDMTKLEVGADSAWLEVYDTGGTGPVVCASHPVDAYSRGSAELLAQLTEGRVVCINPRGVGASTASEWESMQGVVTDLELAREQLGISKWTFWGLSGGGWLGQIYGREHGKSLNALVLESACASYRERLSDPACVMSPHSPAWRSRLEEAGMLSAATSGGQTVLPDGARLKELAQWKRVDGIGTVLVGPEGEASLVVPEGADFDQMLRAQLKFLSFDSRSWLTEIEIPVLCIAGTEDPVAPIAHTRALSERLSLSTLYEAVGAGHTPCVQGHEGAIDALRGFLASLSY